MPCLGFRDLVHSQDLAGRLEHFADMAVPIPHASFPKLDQSHRFGVRLRRRGPIGGPYKKERSDEQPFRMVNARSANDLLIGG